MEALAPPEQDWVAALMASAPNDLTELDWGDLEGDFLTELPAGAMEVNKKNSGGAAALDIAAEALPLRGELSFGPDFALPLLDELLADPLLQAPSAQQFPNPSVPSEHSSRSTACRAGPSSGSPSHSGCSASGCVCSAGDAGGRRPSAADVLQQFARQAAEQEDGFELGSSQGSPPRLPASPPHAPAADAPAAQRQAGSCVQPPSARNGAPQASPQAAAQAETPGAWATETVPARASMVGQAASGKGNLAVEAPGAGIVAFGPAQVAGAARGTSSSIGSGAAPGASASPCVSAAAQPCSSGDSSAAAAGRPAAGVAGPPGATAGTKRQRSGQEECSSDGSAAVTGHAPTVSGAAAVPSGTAGRSEPARNPALAAAGSDGGGAPGADGEERKRQARMARNRESALHSRQRKKMQADELERRCDTLQADNRRLAGLVQHLSTENLALRAHLAAAQQPAGGASPTGPWGAAPLAGPAAVPAGGPAPMPLPGVPALTGGYAPMAWMPGMQVAGTPKVPIQKIKPVRPAPAARHTPALEVFAPKAPPRKRARVAAGGTALLALFCFAVFSGPMLPLGGVFNFNGAAPVGQEGTGTQLAMLPEGVRAGGRVLQALEPMEGNWSEEAAAALGAVDALSLVQPGGWDPAEGLGSTVPQGRLALQQLKDLAPMTLYTDAGAAGGLVSAWSQMPASLGGNAGGLMPPLQCKEVFTLEAGPNVDAELARRQLAKYVGTFRGRALLGPLPLPPAKGRADAPQEEQVAAGAPRSKIGCDKDEPEVIVSIMLGEGTERGAKQIYVVVVQPKQKFSTYACSVPGHVSLR